MIIDASVAVHWLVSTAFSNSARRYLAAGLAAPGFIRIETANALLKYCRAGHIDASNIVPAILKLDSIFENFADDRDLIAEAAHWAVRLNHPVYDCLYLALAIRRDEPLVTADRRLAGVAARPELGLQVDFVSPGD
jgi:predicted nucleic acid-binding protein